MKNQKGVISLFVLFAMLFLLVFCLSVYFGIRSKLQTQEYKSLEIKEIYAKSVDSSESTEYALSNELIPIYNINQLNIAGTGSYLKIDKKIYQCGRGMSYVLKNNIIVDIEEDLISKKVGFNDYKLYSSSYYIDKISYGIYYYKDGSYWKNIAYQKFSDNEKIVENSTYLQNEFSILGEYDFFNNHKYTFMIIWNDENGNLNNYKIGYQDINYNLTNLNQIEIFNEVYNNIDKKQGEYYMFVNLGNSI